MCLAGIISDGAGARKAHTNRKAHNKTDEHENKNLLCLSDLVCASRVYVLCLADVLVCAYVFLFISVAFVSVVCFMCLAGIISAYGVYEDDSRIARCYRSGIGFLRIGHGFNR